MIYTLIYKQQLYCDIATAWDFFSAPNNLAKITPKEMGFVVLTDLPNQNIYEGLIIDYTVSPLFGIKMKWQTKITQVDFQKSFTDYQQKGPYKLWKHHHQFIPNDLGVLMIDTLNYELPFGLIGQLTHWLIVKNKLNDIFNYRHKVLEDIFNKIKK
jgi:ligand-binding SRPBCC domain-containing protein